jgi:thiamine-monophosphate kinase
LRSEAGIIERIWAKLPTGDDEDRRRWLEIGVGDDAAVLRGAPVGLANYGRTADWALSTDAFLEGSHFLTGIHPPGTVGYKALARATSDLAAMGAEPRFFLLNLALSPTRTARWLDGFLAGMAEAAREFRMVLIGGDTSRNETITVNLTVGGTVSHGRALTRSGARPGDGVYVTGALGAAQLGLELLLRGRSAKEERQLLKAQLHPKIQVEVGRWLAGASGWKPIASAAIDTSDGLSTDLDHICRASGVGARIFAERIPCVQEPAWRRRRGTDPLRLALHGGEDYQLLFTAQGTVPAQYKGVRITRIGEVVPLRALSRRGNPRHGERRSSIELVRSDGSSSRLEPRGWDHFRS